MLLFQSMLPAREAPPRSMTLSLCPDDFNPRFPRGKRQAQYRKKNSWRTISIHASREGSDTLTALIWMHSRNFNPRFPRGKRLYGFRLTSQYSEISIHASREGSDHGSGGQYGSPTISIHASREGSDPHSGWGG